MTSPDEALIFHAEYPCDGRSYLARSLVELVDSKDPADIDGVTMFEPLLREKCLRCSKFVVDALSRSETKNLMDHGLL